MKTSSIGVKFICGWEAYRSSPYSDESGHLTWGYGHKQQPGEQPPAHISVDSALALMAHDLAPVERTINTCVKVPITQEQFDAIASLAYNIGQVAMAGSMLIRMVNHKMFTDAAEQFLRWDNVRNPGTGKLEPSLGLLARRKSERAIFIGGGYNWEH